ncbi:DUF2076 domain-containing protein [Atlantibacter hermannii]|uniref:Periplasmic ligand-binding sensor protein n=1 Tax=Atlantibacter hermannii NBRC 105704 TaxID=1115512 RepID=H5V4M5_ATLHE|nr:DUF2076 domain-containing protein [Atlantibacter hermannii]MCQ4968208.1 DUF2076 domain-containing protein [Enterobacteriaceae bacterium DFI.7.85]HAI48893.1 DUF2076 domain-containing protein [Enterobacteriaceae bacterium]KIU33795.1 ABC transporter substrate-binding protein [Atlantibacter hermannii]MBW9430580.1 DUF2076 domain-containing protein [Atlantibacter hermannii]MDU1950744.1 DUF2076 domain-containing protein [Atlantibacter hermannii]
MQSEEQRLIDGLFTRLQQAETQSAPRDADAEARIVHHLQQQPQAPYYMAQTILIQEAAIKQLNQRLQALEGQLAQREQEASHKPESGGFLAGLFGGGSTRSRQPDRPIPGADEYARTAPGNYTAPPATAQGYGASRGQSFMGGALQTAAGVAGGVLMANMLTNMFSHSQPEEIVNIIDDPGHLADNGPVNAVDDYNEADDSQFLNQDAGLPQDNVNDYASQNDTDFGTPDDSDFGNDFGDDDSWT